MASQNLIIDPSRKSDIKLPQYLFFSFDFLLFFNHQPPPFPLPPPPPTPYVSQPKREGSLIENIYTPRQVISEEGRWRLRPNTNFNIFFDISEQLLLILILSCVLVVTVAAAESRLQSCPSN